MEAWLFLLCSYLAVGFGLLAIQHNGLSIAHMFKLAVMWLPLLLVYFVFLRRRGE